MGFRLLRKYNEQDKKKPPPKPGFNKELNNEFNLDDCNLDLKAPFIRLSLLYL